MHRSPRTPRDCDNTARAQDASADRGDEVNGRASGDENDGPDNAFAPLTERKRGRSANWTPCEQVGAFLARQVAVREHGSQSKTALRINTAARAYPAIICALDQEGLCVWSDVRDSTKLPGSASESIQQQTAPSVDSKILSKGDLLRNSLKIYSQTFGRLYPDFSKNGYFPGTGDNDGTAAWRATESACVHELRSSALPAGVEASQLAYRIVCSSSPYLPQNTALRTHIDASFALDPAQRLDQEDVPTEKDLKAHIKRRMTEAKNDPRFGQLPRAPADELAIAEKDNKFREELIDFMKLCKSELRDLRDERVPPLSVHEERISEKEKELSERERQLVDMEARLSEKMSQVDAMQQRVEAALAAVGHVVAPRSLEHDEVDPSACASFEKAEYPTVAPVVERRSQRQPKRKVPCDD